MVAEIKATLKIKSPSGVMADEVGAMIPAGLIAGIQGGAGGVASAMASLVRVPQVGAVGVGLGQSIATGGVRGQVTNINLHIQHGIVGDPARELASRSPKRSAAGEVPGHLPDNRVTRRWRRDGASRRRHRRDRVHGLGVDRRHHLRVVRESKVSVRAGRTTEFDDVGPSTCTLILRNDDGRFTPDSAGSPYYPDVIEGRRIRVTVTESAVDYPLFTGSILSWEPNYAGGMLSNGTVTVTANDALATLALHTFDSRWVEETRALARTAATWADVYVLKGDASTAAWDNIGVSPRAADYGTAILVPATAAVGEVSYGTPASLVLEASAEFKPSTEVGTVVTVTPAAAPEAVSFWLQVPTGTLPTSTDYVLQVRAGGTEVVSIRLVNSGGTCNLTAVGTLGLIGTLASGVADAAWRLISITQSGSDIAVTSTTTAGAVTALTGAGLDLTTCTRMLLGAEIDDGAPNLAASMLVAGLSVAGDATVVPSYLRALPGQTYLHTALYSSFQTYVPEVTTWATTGGEVRTIGEPTWAGQTALSVLQTIARTINGVAYVDGSGNVTLAAADIVRPGVSAASLDIELDLDATAAMPTLRRASDSRPTRVTIGYAGGTTTLVDAAAEANLQPRREVKLETCAVDVAGATFAGSYVLLAANGLRITQVAVDLTTSVTNLWATFLGLYPTQRITISGFDAALIGEATKVVFVQGWQVALDHESLVYTLDCSPASQFVSARGTRATSTGGGRGGPGSPPARAGPRWASPRSGTLVITFTGSYGLTLDAGQYPLYLDWDGEAVRIDAPPGGSTSPQTVTIAARAQQNTAAQVHVSGEAVEIFHAAVWGF
jgi:hypothetical protein